MIISEESISKLHALLCNAGRPLKTVIVSHTNPDGDAIGSSLALRALFAHFGHEAACVLPNKFPYFLDWVPEAGGIHIFRNDPQGVTDLVSAAEVIVCADMSNLSRLEQLSEAIEANTSATRILVDHHLSPEEGFDVMFSHPESSSASFLVYSIIEKMLGTDVISMQTAVQLYVGMMTDTGNFSFSYLTPELFRAVAVLAEKGIDIPQIYNNVYNSFTEGRARLFGYVINRKMRTLRKGTVAYMTLTEEEMRRFWFRPGDSEGFVNYPLTVKKMKMSAIFIESGDFIRISFRSRGDVDVNVFARRYFNGGGHRNAAGGKSFAPMQETVDRYLEAVEEFAREGGFQPNRKQPK